MKTPAEWEDWCDAVWKVRGEYPTWHEPITAIQEDATGGRNLVEALLEEPTAPAYGAKGVGYR